MYTNGRYSEAIEFYTKALENSQSDTPNLHIFHGNRAAALHELERFEEALADAKKAVEIDPKYVKAYIRKAQAERELLMND